MHHVRKCPGTVPGMGAWGLGPALLFMAALKEYTLKTSWDHAKRPDGRDDVRERERERERER